LGYFPEAFFLTSAADQEAFDPKGLEEKFETVAGVDRSVRRRPRPAGRPA